MEEKLIRPGTSFFAPVGENKQEMKPEIAPEMMKPEMMKPESMANMNAKGDADCGYKSGDLPSCAPLAAGFVPWQRNAQPVYESADALTRGTLFPGLDLPFMNLANKGNPYAGTPLGELMAISFVVHELVLYLDTHNNDAEAFALLKSMLRLRTEAYERYTRLYGPVSPADLAMSEKFDWTHSPWPWESGRGGAE